MVGDVDHGRREGPPGVVPSHEVSGVVDTASPAASEAAVGETVYGLLTSGLAVAA
jgi:hypothetical protein